MGRSRFTATTLLVAMTIATACGDKGLYDMATDAVPRDAHDLGRYIFTALQNQDLDALMALSMTADQEEALMTRLLGPASEAKGEHEDASARLAQVRAEAEERIAKTRRRLLETIGEHDWSKAVWQGSKADLSTAGPDEDEMKSVRVRVLFTLEGKELTLRTDRFSLTEAGWRIADSSWMRVRDRTREDQD